MNLVSRRCRLHAEGTRGKRLYFRLQHSNSLNSLVVFAVSLAMRTTEKKQQEITPKCRVSLSLKSELQPPFHFGEEHTHTQIYVKRARIEITLERCEFNWELFQSNRTLARTYGRTDKCLLCRHNSHFPFLLPLLFTNNFPLLHPIANL